MNNRIPWERDLVERPFCQQLQIMGWQWLEGDTDVPELTDAHAPVDSLIRVQ